ncbi:MAG: 16S rRNA (guanine(527)-N(7))-methyltransferase RsmG [Pseudomonadales bacterium]
MLVRGTDQLGLQLSPAQIQSALDYVQLLLKWNRAYNLTAVRDPYDMITKHLLDSFSIYPYFTGVTTVADIGCGAGLPGIPLAIIYPDTHFTLVDSNGKKTRFVAQAAAELDLPNIDCRHSRVEEVISDNGFSVVTSRAFSSLGDMVTKCGHLLAPEGRFLAMKGIKPTEELSEIPSDYTVCAIHSVNVPGLQAQRHLVDIRPLSK